MGIEDGVVAAYLPTDQEVLHAGLVITIELHTIPLSHVIGSKANLRGERRVLAIRLARGDPGDEHEGVIDQATRREDSGGGTGVLTALDLGVASLGVYGGKAVLVAVVGLGAAPDGVRVETGAVEGKRAKEVGVDAIGLAACELGGALGAVAL